MTVGTDLCESCVVAIVMQQLKCGKSGCELQEIVAILGVCTVCLGSCLEHLRRCRQLIAHLKITRDELQFLIFQQSVKDSGRRSADAWTLCQLYMDTFEGLGNVETPIHPSQ